MDISPLYLLTAPSGAGKTTFCAALAEQARAAGWDVAGILCPPVFENGVKTGILAQNLRSGETRPLAQLAPSHSPLSTSSPSHFPLGRWLFSPSTLAWGNDLLAACLPADLFIVDELGPLELIRSAGWTNALEALRSRRYRAGIAVVRPELIETAQKIFPQSEALPLPRSASEFFAHWKEMLP